LINKLVDDIPQPLFGELKWYRTVLRIYEAIKQMGRVRAGENALKR
jgi:hypothetical protein